MKIKDILIRLLAYVLIPTYYISKRFCDKAFELAVRMGVKKDGQVRFYYIVLPSFLFYKFLNEWIYKNRLVLKMEDFMY